ncbi:hypothetical protein BMS3Bbin02_00294 [bacterium BMS3Bbin02]|nr:hypothetical protein BMS3Bbin02_00294 [bacterium BMS3Bbin02]
MLDAARKAERVLDGIDDVGGAANRIANGHAWAKHAAEFPDVASVGQFESLVLDVMENASEAKELVGGRRAFWSEGTLVIFDPASIDGGTVFRPRDGFAYYEGLS